jgi:hypothetical protein
MMNHKLILDLTQELAIYSIDVLVGFIYMHAACRYATKLFLEFSFLKCTTNIYDTKSYKEIRK